MKTVDIAEILKYAPIGIILYTDIFGKVIFDGIVDDIDYPIHVKTPDGMIKTYTKEGGFSLTAKNKCGLWPSSYKNSYNEYTWDNWQNIIFKQPVCKGAVLCRNNNIHDKWIIETDRIISLSNWHTEGINNFDLDNPSVRNFKFINPILGVSVNNKEINPKPGELVIVSLLQENDVPLNLNKWQVAVFSHKEKYNAITYYVANSKVWRNCIPLNKYTEHLIGTSEYDFVYEQDSNKK